MMMSKMHLVSGSERACMPQPSRPRASYTMCLLHLSKMFSCAPAQLEPQGRRYSLRDCSVVCLIVIGLATFMNAETRSSTDAETPCSLLGVACISLALVIDAANINIQVR